MKYIIDLINQVWDTTYTPEQQASLGLVFDVNDSETNNNGLIAVKGDTAYVAFRGTVMNKQNILEDLFEFPLKRTRADFEYHAGFYFAYSNLRTAILDKLKTLDVKHIIVLGHSLGAAMAGICAIDLIQQGFDVSEVYWLACPKFVNRKGMHFLKTRTKINSFINGNDAIWFVAPFLRRGKTKRIGKRLWWKPASFCDHLLIDGPHNQGYISSIKQYFGDKY